MEFMSKITNMDRDIKAAFFDVDGTLLSFKTHEVPESTKKAIEQLKENGVKVFVATGRSPKAFERVKQLIDIDFDGYVYLNGQYVIVDDKVIHNKALNKESIKKLMPYIEDKEIAVHFAELDYGYMNFENDRVRELNELLGSTVQREYLKDTSRAFDNETYQLSVYITEDEEDDFFNNVDGLKAVRWNHLFCDVIPEDGGKPNGIQAILDNFGFTRDQAIAFGDGGNDTDMLKHVGLGIAMGNAVDEAKNVADHVTDSVDNEGIHKALVKFKLVKEK